LLFSLLAPILVLMGGLAVWSNHFEGVFQDADFHVIVNNRAIRDLRNIPHFFVRPLLYADKPEYAEYRPLAEASYALDYRLASPINPGVYSIDSFGWFLLSVLMFGLLVALLPGANRWAAFLAAGLFAFHPLAVDTVNYASRRGDLMGTAALCAALAFWIVWPRRLPKEIMHWEGVPKTEWDDFRRRWSPTLNLRYRAFVTAPLHLYLIPVVFGLFADPGVAVFPLLMLAYILLFDNGPKRQRPWKRVLPSALVCTAFWFGQMAITWKYGAGFRLSPFSYWLAQPWVIVHYILKFLGPVSLTAVSDLPGFPGLPMLLMLLGVVGFGALVFLAIRMGRRSDGGGVAFGLWWFLICSLPAILVPQRPAEAFYRLFPALPGLALALGRAAYLLYRRLEETNRFSRLKLNLVAALVAAALILPCCYLTFDRNKIWSSEESFWRDATEKNPGNGRAFVELASVLYAAGQVDQGNDTLKHALSLTSGDAPDELRIAAAFDLINVDSQAEKYYKKAIADDPGYASAWSAYSQWLIHHQKLAEAFKDAQRAVEISPWNLEAQHTLLDYYSQTIDWENLLKASQTLLSHDPTDEDGRRSLSVANSAFEEVQLAEQRSKIEPSVDQFLHLSVEYYKTRRYADSIEACRQALKLRPDLAEAWSNEAAAYYALGNLDDAIHALREAIRLRPDLDVAKKNLAFLLDKKSAGADQNSAKTSTPDSTTVH
jgi:tetratricopeptide (TPR) repeat protein